jgi:hypothetical protein
VPNASEIRREIERSVRRHKLESIVVDEQIVEVYSFLGPATHVYVDAALSSLGGQKLAISTGEPISAHLPWFVEKPWHQHSLLTRLRISVAYWVNLQ